MVHTLPDWTTKYNLTTIFSQIDTGELAVRLKSIVSYDRRGNVFFMDDFESSVIHWIVPALLKSGTAELSTDYARSGNQSLAMTPDAGLDETVYVYRYLPHPVLSKIGLEVSFTCPIEMQYIILRALFICNDIYSTTGLLFHPGSDSVFYWGSDGQWHDFAYNWFIDISPDLFFTMKYVVDLTTGKYVRCLVNEKSYDLSEHSYHTEPADVNPYMFIDMTVCNGGDTTPTAYFDDVILTQNEP